MGWVYSEDVFSKMLQICTANVGRVAVSALVQRPPGRLLESVLILQYSHAKFTESS